MQPVWENKCSPPAAPTKGGSSVSSERRTVKGLDTRWRSKSFFISNPPSFHPQRWCNPFPTILSHGRSPCGNTLIPTPRRYHSCRYLRLLRSHLGSGRSFDVSLMDSVWFCRFQALPSGHAPADVHPSWLLKTAVTLAVIKSYSRHTNPLLWSHKLLTFSCHRKREPKL